MEVCGLIIYENPLFVPPPVTGRQISVGFISCHSPAPLAFVSIRRLKGYPVAWRWLMKLLLRLKMASLLLRRIIRDKTISFCSCCSKPYVGHALITATVCVLQREEREGSARPSWGIIHLAATVLTDCLLLQAVSCSSAFVSVRNVLWGGFFFFAFRPILPPAAC